MQNKRGLELALSTVIVVVIVVLVLVGITYLLTDGFKKFRSTTAPFLESTDAVAVRQVCESACTVEDNIAFCNKYTFKVDANGKEITDPKVDVKQNCLVVYKAYKLADCSITC